MEKNQNTALFFCQGGGRGTGYMTHPAEIGCFSSEGSITPDLDKENNANFFGNN